LPGGSWGRGKRGRETQRLGGGRRGLIGGGRGRETQRGGKRGQSEEGGEVKMGGGREEGN